MVLCKGVCHIDLYYLYVTIAKILVFAYMAEFGNIS